MKNEPNTPDNLTIAVEELANFMLQIQRTQDKRETEFLAMLGNISLQQLRVLNIIGELEPCTMSQIAEETKNSLSSTTLIVNKLVKSDLIARLRTEKDRRLVKAKLTAKGKQLYNVQVDFMRLLSRKILMPLSGDEQTLISNVIGKIRDSL